MAIKLRGYEDHVRKAVSQYWTTLTLQATKQNSNDQDRGNRKAVTGGRQMNGFCELVRWVATENGMPDACVFARSRLELPGFFRPTKKWDLLVVFKERLVAAVEFKSHAGPSFGNNLNNRTEEALGNATDIWTAYREGAFGLKQPRPWIGWLMLVESCKGSTTQVGYREPHFKVFPEFKDTSYADRYELLLKKLLSEKLYDGAALIVSTRKDGPEGKYLEPSTDLAIKKFLAGLGGQVQTFLATE